MLSEKEENFIIYWESVRVEYSNWKSKIIRGLPMAIVFTLPVLFSVSAVYFFSPEWYTKIAESVNGSIFAILIALLISVLFFSAFRMHFKWEMNEQIYMELKIKKNQHNLQN